MTKAILIPVLVGFCAYCAHAGGVSPTAAMPFKETSQDFGKHPVGEENIHLDHDPDVKRGYYWSSPADAALVKTKVADWGGTKNYLEIWAPENPSDGLSRRFLAQGSPSEPLTNALTMVTGEGAYSGFYCSFKTQFPLFEAGTRPETDGHDRLIFWAVANGGSADLYVTAGCFRDGFHSIESHDFRIATGVNPADWHQLVLRVIPDAHSGSQALGFAIWLDGNRVVAEAGDYPILGDRCSVLHLSSEARLMVNERRFFPALTDPGSNDSVSLGGVAFTGVGTAAEFGFTSAAPAEWAKPDRIFTLRWDAGVKTISYRIGSGATITVPSSELAVRSAVAALPSAAVDIAVTVTYDTAAKYYQGFWGAAGSCSVVTNGPASSVSYAFRCDDSGADGTGFVRSCREEIGLGGGIGSFATFADAKEQAILQGKVMVLNGDFAADPSGTTRDLGRIFIDKGEALTIDLNGHSLTNANSQYPTIYNKGKLTIIDSVGGGRVVPYRVFRGNTNDTEEVAIRNYATKQETPELRLEGGTYDGWINNLGSVVAGGRLSGKLAIVRSDIETDTPKFISAVDNDFAYADFVDDPKLCYAYTDPYWQPFTYGFIWCGKGTDARWSNPDNWRGGLIPGSGDQAIFPPIGTNAWEVNFESGISVGSIWFSADAVLHGEADFSNISWTIPEPGRVRGDATLTWTGKLPPDLTTLIDERWAGTVEIVDVGNSSPKLMGNLATWGTASSAVRFAGVRGYYHSTVNLILPYALQLENGSNGYAWKNDAGFTGAVIVFPSLSGYGKFLSPKNTIANLQQIIFRDVLSFYGELEVRGKRVVLGPGVAATLEAGSVTWSDGVSIRSGLAPDCDVAAFGGAMTFTGNYGDPVAKYAKSTVGDESAVVTLQPGDFIAELCVTNPVGVVRVVRWSEDAVIVDGRRMIAEEVSDVNSLSSIEAPSLAAVPKLTFAPYYTSSVSGGRVMLSLNNLAVPVIGSASGERAKITFADGLASVVVSGVIDGLWYGLEYKATLAEPWPDEPYLWTVADASGDQVELVAPADGVSGFYRVVVSDVGPEAGAGK